MSLVIVGSLTVAAWVAAAPTVARAAAEPFALILWKGAAVSLVIVGSLTSQRRSPLKRLLQ